MNKLRYLVVGSGWRSLFYLRIARALPERFEVCAVLCRTWEKAEKISREYQAPVSISIEECQAMKPDFVVVAVNKASIFSVTKFWAEAGFPVLCETPASLDLAELNELWRLQFEKGLKIQVAEQYFLYPTLASRLAVVKSGILGEPACMTLSLAHDYHGSSLIRKFLNVGFQPVQIWGKSYPVSVTETDSRWGPVIDGPVVEKYRDRLTFEFEGGKTAFYDFCPVQYHSFIRSRHLNVQGPSGELDDFTVRYLDQAFRPVTQTMELQTGTQKDLIESVWLGDQIVYENPFPGSGLAEDETAIAAVLDGMEAYIQTGTELYPLSEALQDAYLAILMKQALECPGTIITAYPQPWADIH